MEHRYDTDARRKSRRNAIVAAAKQRVAQRRHVERRWGDADGFDADQENDVYKHLRLTETVQHRRHAGVDYPALYAANARRQAATSNARIVDGAKRAVLVDWIFDVCAEEYLAAETPHIAVRLLDHYLAVAAAANPPRFVVLRRFQLYGIAALFVASKLEDRTPITCYDLVDFTNFTYVEDELCDVELAIVARLRGDVSSVHSLDFVPFYVGELVRTLVGDSVVADAICRHDVRDMVVCLCDLSLADYDGIVGKFTPSCITAAACCVALHVLYADTDVAGRYWNSEPMWLNNDHDDGTAPALPDRAVTHTTTTTPPPATPAPPLASDRQAAATRVRACALAIHAHSVVNLRNTHSSAACRLLYHRHTARFSDVFAAIPLWPPCLLPWPR